VIPKTPVNLHLNKYWGYQHVGLLLMLDLRGNLLIRPSLVESVMLHGLTRPIRSRHYMTRYQLALLLLYGRLGVIQEIGFWPLILNKCAKFARDDINAVDKDLLRQTYGVFFQEGVSFTWGNRQFSTSATQYNANEAGAEVFAGAAGMPAPSNPVPDPLAHTLTLTPGGVAEGDENEVDDDELTLQLAAAAPPAEPDSASVSSDSTQLAALAHEGGARERLIRALASALAPVLGQSEERLRDALGVDEVAAILGGQDPDVPDDESETK
jgi:hypothetical protein